MTKRFNYLYIFLLVLAGTATFGFECNKTPGAAFFVLKRFSSIPPITRSVTFSSDCTATIRDPINTTSPFMYDMTKEECDSLKSLCSGYASFDTLYVDTLQRIPNPASIVLEFHANGATKTVTIVQFPKVANGLIPLLKYAGGIELRGLNMMEQMHEKEQGNGQ